MNKWKLVRNEKGAPSWALKTSEGDAPSVVVEVIPHYADSSLVFKLCATVFDTEEVVNFDDPFDTIEAAQEKGEVLLSSIIDVYNEGYNEFG